MYAFFFFTFWSILLLVAETLLRSAGLTFPLLGLFFPAAAFVISPRMAFGFALVFGVSMDFVLGDVLPWDGLLLPLLTLPSFFLKRTPPAADALEFLAGAMIPPVLAIPHVLTVLTTPEAFASLIMSSLVCAVLFPVMAALISHSAARLEIGIAGGRNGGV
ncbi:MAG: hypothetical protein J6Y92_01925 [Lentisphaeria bacterium]|nr:hypothetical protein [Lentisphaeria bacterium]